MGVRFVGVRFVGVRFVGVRFVGVRFVGHGVIAPPGRGGRPRPVPGRRYRLGIVAAWSCAPCAISWRSPRNSTSAGPPPGCT
ncbi:hypothetical protein ACH4D5_34635 [Streptomyces sp. NPDC018029]|uniref:hypothetical protein n=1 Tax=Streptomyces sp. NPDC018029 TaxID=3365032 RepID=UPI00378BF874